MSTDTEIIRLVDHYGLPEEVVYMILKQVNRWTPPKVDDQGYVISKLKNTHQCPTSLVLSYPQNSLRWQRIRVLPALNSYERRVCLWKPEYYDLKPVRLSCITGITNWVRMEGHELVVCPLLEGVDRRSEEWIGFKSWLHTHPTFLKHTFRWDRKNSKMLTDHWFKYDLALAYPPCMVRMG